MTASDRANQLVQIAADAAAEKLAENIIAYDVSEQLIITDAFLLCSAANDRQVRAIVDEIEKTIIYSNVNPAEEPDQFLTDMEAMAKLGIQKVWVSNNKVGDDPAGWAAKVCAETVTRLDELG